MPSIECTRAYAIGVGDGLDHSRLRSLALEASDSSRKVHGAALSEVVERSTRYECPIAALTQQLSAARTKIQAGKQAGRQTYIGADPIEAGSLVGARRRAAVLEVAKVAIDREHRDAGGFGWRTLLQIRLPSLEMRLQEAIGGRERHELGEREAARHARAAISQQPHGDDVLGIGPHVDRMRQLPMSPSMRMGERAAVVAKVRSSWLALLLCSRACGTGRVVQQQQQRASGRYAFGGRDRLQAAYHDDAARCWMLAVAVAVSIVVSIVLSVMPVVSISISIAIALARMTPIALVDLHWLTVQVSIGRSVTVLAIPGAFTVSISVSISIAIVVSVRVALSSSSRKVLVDAQVVLEVVALPMGVISSFIVAVWSVRVVMYRLLRMRWELLCCLLLAQVRRRERRLVEAAWRMERWL